ncbi:hypothetical protein KJ691_00800 [bacterium]|nr:hypothetical protein [bacterium]
MKLIFTSIILALLVLTGCNTQPVKEKNSKFDQPSWIMKPSQNGKIGAVGTAYRHYKGLAYQRKLAITRALDELTLQQGVKVNLRMEKEVQVVNDRASSSLDVKSDYTANNTITAHIEEIWQDPMSQEFFVWMVLD